MTGRWGIEFGEGNSAYESTTLDKAQSVEGFQLRWTACHSGLKLEGRLSFLEGIGDGEEGRL